MCGTSTRNFRMFRELCGDSGLKNVVILTNMWGQVTKDVGEARERELATDNLFFKPVLDKGAQMLRHDHTLASAQKVLRYFFNNQPAVLQIQREIVGAVVCRLPFMASYVMPSASAKISRARNTSPAAELRD